VNIAPTTYPIVTLSLITKTRGSKRHLLGTPVVVLDGLAPTVLPSKHFPVLRMLSRSSKAPDPYISIRIRRCTMYTLQSLGTIGTTTYRIATTSGLGACSTAGPANVEGNHSVRSERFDSAFLKQMYPGDELSLSRTSEICRLGKLTSWGDVASYSSV
jgi:hypothetical protein